MENHIPNKRVLKIWRYFLLLVVLLITLNLSIGESGLKSASAVGTEPPERINPRPIGSEPPFVPPANGFTWQVPARFGLDVDGNAKVDYHWNSATFNYDPAYIYPDHWSMIFDGCQTAQDAELGDSAPNTYTWQLDGRTFSGHRCVFTYDQPGFSAQGTYTVTLQVRDPNNQPVPAGTPSFQQQVYIKDYLIVSVGDSYASGEGNPDIRQFVMPLFPLPGWGVVSPASWEDDRCHRSVYAGPAQAAIALEYSDPHTSVTFLSYACSGATILNPTYDAVTLQWWPPFLNLDPDINKPRGIGILGPYIGREIPSGTNYGEYDEYVPSQIGQLQLALNPPAGKTRRQFDALVLSAGGNDFHFGDIAQACLLDDNCFVNSRVNEFPNSPKYDLQLLISRAVTPYPNGSVNSLPAGYAQLDNEIRHLNPIPAKVYITQYPDLTRNDSGGFCRMLDDIFWPLNYAITTEEAGQASNLALSRLNQAVKQAADLYHWQYVDGLAKYEVDPLKTPGTPGQFVVGPDGKGHGYCASDNWIRRAEESEVIQGPVNLRFANQGTLHPTSRGHQAIKERILYYLLPNLNAVRPSNPPTFTSSLTSGGLTSTAGVNGWYTGSCGAGSCYPKVVLQVTAKGSTQLRAASEAVNDVDGCSAAGAACPKTVITPTNEVRWDFTFPYDGIYRLQLTAKDSDNQIATFENEIKVDLHDPVFSAQPGPFSVNEGGSVQVSAQASDAASATLDYDWDLDNDGTFETTAEQPTFSAAGLDGPVNLTVGVRVTDEAGRSAATTATVNVVNVDPSPAIDGVLANNLEGIAINLTSSVTDPGSSDTFTYAWTVKKNGSTFATGSADSFSFTPDDNGSYEVSLSVTDDDGGVGTDTQTISVSNVAPALSNVAASPTPVNEGGSVTLSGSLSDPGSMDTFQLTVSWGDGSDSTVASLPAGSTGFSLSHTYRDDNPTGTSSDTNNLTLSLKDDDNGGTTGSASVVVNNLDPTLSISAPTGGALYAINDIVTLTGAVSDPGADDTLSCSVNWDDGSSETVTPSAGVCAASHAYTSAGVYTIQATAGDDDTGSDGATVMVVVYDPSAGFVTGGGWISSPAGAYTPDPTLTGQAHFGFVAKYQRGASIPVGQTAFRFQAGSFAFQSEAYEWLVVAGARAQFKGTGSVNGVSGYSFLLTLTDGQVNGGGGVDKFRIKIWDANGVVYDNMIGFPDDMDGANPQEIGGGSIVIHS